MNLLKKNSFNPDKRSHKEQSANDILGMLIKGYRLDTKLQELTIEETWKNVMGSGVANHTNSVFFKKHTLYVRFSSAVLREELSYKKEQIIAMLNNDMREEVIKELIFI